MKWVVLRDDDANGLTPPALLERLYRPYLDRGMPVHLAVIPAVRTDARDLAGALEGFLTGDGAGRPGTAPLADNAELVSYLRSERRYRLLQHGLHHEMVDGRFEFDRDDARDLARRLDEGARRFEEAGLARPTCFVAPQDQLSRAAVREAARRFAVVSTGWFDLARVPRRWWPRYLAAKKVRGRRHWRAPRCAFLTHPGCLLSPSRSVEGAVDRVLGALAPGEVTVVVLHHWEAFVAGQVDAPLVAAVHELAERLWSAPDVRVVDIEAAAGLI